MTVKGYHGILKVTMKNRRVFHKKIFMCLPFDRWNLLLVVGSILHCLRLDMSLPFPRPFLATFFAWYLLMRPVSGEGEHSVSYKFQWYAEDDGRMEIPSHYLLLETSLPYQFSLSAKVLTNIMTGSSPTGLMDPENPDEIALAEVEDQRWAYIVALTKDFEDHSLTFEYARSEEDDYISNGLTLRSQHQFNKENTTLQFGLSYTDDTVTAEPLSDERGKESLDFAVGLTQILTRKTILQANFTLGYSRGYLGDPYKSIGRSETFVIPGLPPFSEDIAYFENRPDERMRYVFRLGLLQYVEALRGSFEGSYRLFQDDRDLRAHTLKLQWNQEIADSLVISPYYRFYHQDAADYYAVNLNDAAFEPNNDRSGRAPYYSADYRLSNLDSHTYGIKLSYRPTDWLSLDAAYERYVMSGNDSVTPSAAYPKAHVVNLGFTARF